MEAGGESDSSPSGINIEAIADVLSPGHTPGTVLNTLITERQTSGVHRRSRSISSAASADEARNERGDSSDETSPSARTQPSTPQLTFVPEDSGEDSMLDHLRSHDKVRSSSKSIRKTCSDDALGRKLEKRERSRTSLPDVLHSWNDTPLHRRGTSPVPRGSDQGIFLENLGLTHEAAEEILTGELKDIKKGCMEHSAAGPEWTVKELPTETLTLT